MTTLSAACNPSASSPYPALYLLSLQDNRFDGIATGSATFKLEPNDQLKAARQTAARLLRNDATEQVFIHVIGPITVADVLRRGLLELTLNLNPAIRSSINAIRGVVPRKEGIHC